MSDKSSPSPYEILNQLHNLRDEVEKRIRVLEGQRTQIERAIKNLMMIHEPPISQETQSSFEGPQKKVRGIINPKKIAEAAKEVLLEKMHPMKRGELVKALEEKGILLPGKDKNKNLGTILWRHDHIFIHIEKRGYWLKDRPMPEIIY